MAENFQVNAAAPEQPHRETRLETHAHLLSSLIDAGTYKPASADLKPLPHTGAPEGGVDRVNGQVTGLSFAPQHRESGSTSEILNTMAGASLGRYATRHTIGQVIPAVEEMAAKGSFLKGTTVGLSVGLAEIVGNVALRDDHPGVADFLKPHPVEAGLVGIAASLGGGNWRVRMGLLAGAVVAGKAEYALEKLTGH